MFCKKGVKKADACNFIKEETLAQVFSCDFWENFKNTFFHRKPLVAASEFKQINFCFTRIHQIYGFKRIPRGTEVN